jgi:hypothetical protein
MKKSFYIINGQTELMKFNERWTLEQCEEMPNGCYILIYRGNVNNIDVEKFISEFTGDEEILVEWNW